jgi:hypothetical protein
MTALKYLAAPALLAIVATGMAAPASAAYYDNGNHLRRGISQLDRQIDRLKDQRRISGREAAKLDNRVDRLEATWRSYSRGGFNNGEIRSLSAQIDAVKRDVARQANDANNRAYNGRSGEYHRR